MRALDPEHPLVRNIRVVTIIFDFWGKLAFLLTLTGVGVTSVLAFLRTTEGYILLSAITTLGFGILLIAIYRWRRNTGCFASDFIYLRREVVQKYAPDTERKQSRIGFDLELLACRDGLRSYSGEWECSTSSEFSISTPSEGFAVQEITAELPTRRGYRVDFPTNFTLKKGSVVKFALDLDIFDEHASSPWGLGQHVEIAMRHLILRVIFPLDDPPSNVRLCHYKHERAATEKPGRIDRHTGEVRSDISKPKCGANYGILWDWPAL